MARTIQDLEAYLQATGRPFQQGEDGTFLLVPQGDVQPLVALRVDGPVMTTTVEIGPAPTGDPEGQVALLRRLLELNASDLLYCSYGLRDDSIVLSSAHEIENLDLNEVQAILSDIELALARHLKQLVSLAPPSVRPPPPSAKPAESSVAAGAKLKSWESSPASPSSSRPT